MKATLGRIVHYNDGGTMRAALVIRVRPELHDRVDLRVFVASGDDVTEVAVTEGLESGTWRWPSREPWEVIPTTQTPLFGDLLTSPMVTVAPDMPEPLPNVGASAADGGGELAGFGEDGKKAR